MNIYSEKSETRLNSCHLQLQVLFRDVLRHFDHTILCGHRTEAEQNEAFESGTTKLEWPDSKHNSFPSRAVDAVPCPIPADWNDPMWIKKCYMFVGFVKARAVALGINLRCGADWDGDFDIKDQKFHDIPHFELMDD